MHQKMVVFSKSRLISDGQYVTNRCFHLVCYSVSKRIIISLWNTNHNIFVEYQKCIKEYIFFSLVGRYNFGDSLRSRKVSQIEEVVEEREWWGIKM